MIAHELKNIFLVIKFKSHCLQEIRPYITLNTIDTFVNFNDTKTYRLIIKGKVQGVGFRHWFSNIAISLGLNGYVQNKESKDEVEAIVQGEMKDILTITEKSRTGPELALIEGVIPNNIINNVTYSGFIVKY